MKKLLHVYVLRSYLFCYSDAYAYHPHSRANRPVKMIVPTGTGAANGSWPRQDSHWAMTQSRRKLGKSIVAENMPGASGIVATAAKPLHARAGLVVIHLLSPHTSGMAINLIRSSTCIRSDYKIHAVQWSATKQRSRCPETRIASQPRSPSSS